MLYNTSKGFSVTKKTGKKKKDILLVEDDEGIKITLSALLADFGYSLDSAGNASQAIEYVSSSNYTLVLTDYQLPDLTGLELIKIIKNLGSDSLFIMMTGHSDINIAINALREDVFDFILKPVNPEKLQNILENAFQEKDKREKREALVSELQELTTKDNLTEINNRRYFETIYTLETGRALRYKRALSCLIFDIDDFKKINDTYGHYAGDIVLKEVAQICLRSLRKNDASTLCRWGGDEFVALLPETDTEGAVTCAEHLRKSIENHRIKTENSLLKVTISCGVSSWDRKKRIEDLLYQADMALLKAKKNGKNCIFGGEK